jgi:hypothetical protein
LRFCPECNQRPAIDRDSPAAISRIDCAINCDTAIGQAIRCVSRKFRVRIDASAIWNAILIRPVTQHDLSVQHGFMRFEPGQRINIDFRDLGSCENLSEHFPLPRLPCETLVKWMNPSTRARYAPRMVLRSSIALRGSVPSGFRRRAVRRLGHWFLPHTTPWRKGITRALKRVELKPKSARLEKKSRNTGQRRSTRIPFRLKRQRPSDINTSGL